MSRKRILIVEDEIIIAMHNRMIVEKLGFEVAGLASSGEEAISKALELKPDLILMDIILSGKMNGVVAAIRIKEKQDIPIVFLSSNSDSGTLHDAEKTAPYGFLVKPVSEKDINAIITRAFSSRQ